MTVKEHYVPRFYLTHFANSKGRITVYDFNKKRLFLASSKDLCFKNNLYETPFKNANERIGSYVDRNNIEITFSGYETRFSKLLQRVDQLSINNKNNQALILSSVEKDMLCKFVVNMIVRNPINMEHMNVNHLDEEFLQSEDYSNLTEVLEKMGFGGAKSICEMAQKKAMLTEEYKDSFPDTFAKELRQLDFSFYYAEKGEFITSDNPVLIGKDKNLINEKESFIYCALTPKVSVLFGNY